MGTVERESGKKKSSRKSLGRRRRIAEKLRKKKSNKDKVELEEALVPVKRSRIWTRRKEGGHAASGKKPSFSP